jgi:dipeptidyl aminopeptidase/acylaminoacyl peptidase
MPNPTLLRALAALALVHAAGCATAPAAPQKTDAAPASAPAPLVDRELYFDNPEITGAQLSPDGAFISFLKPHQGVLNVWVKARSEPFASARPLTADQRTVGGYFWSRDGKFVLYVQDKGGDENFHLYAVDPRAPASANGVPEARDLTPGEKLRASILSVPKKTPDSVLVGLNDRDPQLHDVYRVSLSTGKRTLVRLNKEGVAGWTADNEGTLRLANKLDEAGGTVIFRVVGQTLEPLARCSNEESCGAERFHPDGKRVYFETNAGDGDLTRLVLLDLATGQQELVESDPERQVDFGGAAFSELTDELAATFYEGDRLRTYPKSAEFKRDFEAVRKVLTGGDVSFVSSTADEAFRLVTVNSDVDPRATYLYERATGKVELLYRPRPRLPLETLVPMKPVRITARDGLVFTAYLTVPRGQVGPGPAVVLPHGGPWGRDTWGYASLPQFLANRGYVVVQPNFRGSAGYGKKFLNLGNGQWGTGTMQHDVSDTRDWLVKQGYAAEGKVAIMGGSYGGYATLAGLAFTPGLYAAGVDIVGPSNIVTLLNSIPPYWAPLKKLFAVRVGDVEKRADVERLQAQSPLNSATKIKAPLLVIQGANDPRVKQAEADQIVIALRENQLPVEYLVAPDEGHGFRNRDNLLAQTVAIERFLGKHLGGRVQQRVAPDIAAKLAALTVDVAGVKLTPRPAAGSIDTPAR